MKEPAIKITNDILQLIAEIDEFKGEWKAIGNLSPDRLQALKKIATIESVGSSTRIEGVKLTDKEVEALLSGVDTYSFRTRDEEEVAGYAEAMNLIFEAYEEIAITENNIKQILQIVKQHDRVAISDIHSIIKANRNTIKVRLRELVTEGYLQMEGRGKGTRYIMGNRTY